MKVPLVLISIFFLLGEPLSASADNCSAVGPLTKAASELRGLPIKHPVECKVVSRVDFRRLAHKAVLQDIDTNTLAEQGALLEFLGLSPRGYPFSRCIIDEFSRRAAAFFSPQLDQIVLPDWTEIPEAILVHEIVHALQAQYYPTSHFGHRGYLLDDQNLAAGALLEGDAMYIEGRFSELKRSSHASGEGENDPNIDSQLAAEIEGCELPSGIERLASAIYDYGEFFVTSLHKEGRMGDVEHAFAHVPKTSSVLLYPKRYSSSQMERAPEVVQHLPLGPAFHALEPYRGAPHFDVRLGEMTARMVLKEWISSEQAVHAATGWRGDRATVSLSGPPSNRREQTLWTTVWDSEHDAEQFAAAWCSGWGARFGIDLNAASAAISIAVDGSMLELRRAGTVVTVGEVYRTGQSFRKKNGPGDSFTGAAFRLKEVRD